MRGALWIVLLMCTSGACTSFHDSVLSSLEADADTGSDAPAVDEPAADGSTPDAGELSQDAASARLDAAAPAADAEAPLDADVDSALDASEKTCCQQLDEEWYRQQQPGVSLPPPLCVESVCLKLSQPSHP